MKERHPNASMAGATGGATVLLVYVASLFGLEIPPEVAAAATTIVAFVALLLGKRRPTA